jgi:hypothetical protein
MLSIPKIVFCTQCVALNNVGTVKVSTSSPWLLTHAFRCLCLCHHQCLCAIVGYCRHGRQSYILLYTVHCGSQSSPVSQYLNLNLLTTTIVAPPSNASKWQMGFHSAFKGLNISHSLSFHLVYTVITITCICESRFYYRFVCGSSFMYSVTLLRSLFFLLYI